MNAEQVQQCKKSVVKVMGVHRGFDFCKPYRQPCDIEFGGTAFFVDPSIFGDSFPQSGSRKRYALTNFHVVDELKTNTCYLCYPEKGKSQITASVIYIVPTLDVAVLMVDPDDEHPLWFDKQDIGSFISDIPNLRVHEEPVKGNSQNVVAIGFPNLSTDYQLCEGCISGRGHAMIQLSISLNGGNSGGPLLMNGVVIGICTASISDSEALGLAVPIRQAVRFFKHWTSFDDIILRLPSWGIKTRTTTEDYLDYFNVNKKTSGCSVDKIIPLGSIAKANIKENDIITSVHSAGKSYSVDNFGLVSVDWTNKLVKIENQEFILSLNPEDIQMDVFHWNSKKSKLVDVRPHVIDFSVREVYHGWEELSYCILGGVVFMNLSKNHLEVDDGEYGDEDEEEEDEADTSAPLAQFTTATMNLKSAVVVTHIPEHTHVATHQLLHAFDRIVKCNGQDVETVAQLESMINTCVKSYNRKQKQSRFIVLQTDKNKIYLNMETLYLREVQDALDDQYPAKKCQLLKMKVLKKRKRKRAR